ncbi:riboflavin synthase [Leeia sp. TBRC 13508]|uniref:Riboflavin synthase n=1 Tax=Leeia speluncae TaxID=2884804 RepID=A0ABS8D468_9NEIS|nr:riboflavin synthase [Leeia speluncae]MCB6182448.1 riboflavin synthase [Leeia speluncae]
MFTGIIQAVGTITAIEEKGQDVRLTVDSSKLDLGDVGLGDSIAHNGVCLTVIEKLPNGYLLDVSAETLNVTVGLDKVGNLVNLEKAMRLSDRLGGHLVSGHVDGVGIVKSFATPEGEADSDCMELVIDAPTNIARYIAKKGSITVNGVSLTVNKVDHTAFSINLIPHTLQETNLHQLAPGSKVNLEIDLIARYVERMNQFDRA